MESRVGTLSIFIQEKKSVENVNKILTEYSNIVLARMGLPYREKESFVIVLILDGTTDEIGALSGKIGNVEGVSVKTALSKK